jgi:hypothetical protein
MEATYRHDIHDSVETSEHQEQVSLEQLALVPDRLAVLKVSGLSGSDLGEPKRVLAVIGGADLRPPWIQNH